jgi:hypothetical protein
MMRNAVGGSKSEACSTPENPKDQGVRVAHGLFLRAFRAAHTHRTMFHDILRENGEAKDACLR